MHILRLGLFRTQFDVEEVGTVDSCLVLNREAKLKPQKNRIGIGDSPILEVSKVLLFISFNA